MFNDALLAKQCCRLITELNSLWAMVLKARYFSNCSFFDAKRGGRASWAWSSLLAGRDILCKGAHWQIMCGKKVRVWKDRWIHYIPSGIPSPLGSVQVSSNLRVDSLICKDSGEWDIEFLEPFLVRPEFDAILDVLIGDIIERDRLIWPFEKKGVYSVKSGYRWTFERGYSPIYHLPASIPDFL